MILFDETHFLLQHLCLLGGIGLFKLTEFSVSDIDTIVFVLPMNHF